jgi:aspartyl/asparaginyl beta-hydroxylase (cupin superfamily)
MHCARTFSRSAFFKSLNNFLSRCSAIAHRDAGRFISAIETAMTRAESRSHKSEVHLMSFLRRSTYMLVVKKNPQETFSSEQQ